MVALGHLASYLASYLFSQALPLHPLLTSFPGGVTALRESPRGSQAKEERAWELQGALRRAGVRVLPMLEHDLAVLCCVSTATG